MASGLGGHARLARKYPPEQALLIFRKAAAMAETFESKALHQIASGASMALRVEPRRIIR
ncbi:hypothetical protein CR917_04480 [Pseudomonas sp. BRM28]|nr:hypothetical protein CR917_04480 [Pseudomonas sp. BRM28]